MKYLVLVVVIAAVFWWLRTARRRGDPPAAPRPGPSRPANEPPVMVACAMCGLHLPLAEALPGPGGAVYCSEAHRAAHGGAPR